MGRAPPGEGAGADPGFSATQTFAGWELRDPLGRRIGRVSRVYSGRDGRAEHVQVILGRWATRTVLLPDEGI